MDPPGARRAAMLTSESGRYTRWTAIVRTAAGRDSAGNSRRQRRRQSHRGKGPRNYQRSDERVQEDVNDRLSDAHWLDASDIEVSVAEREVTLDGFVGSLEAKRRAEDCAEAVSAVAHVQNNLRVQRHGTQEAAAGSD